MASPRLNVTLSPTAAADLYGIWQWNAERYSPHHADIYLRHLKERVYDLAQSNKLGNVVTGRPDLHYIIIRRKSRGNGHVVVFRVRAATIDVLHIFHTAQDWQTKLASENPNQ